MLNAEIAKIHSVFKSHHFSPLFQPSQIVRQGSFRDRILHNPKWTITTSHVPFPEEMSVMCQEIWTITVDGSADQYSCNILSIARQGQTLWRADNKTIQRPQGLIIRPYYEMLDSEIRTMLALDLSEWHYSRHVPEIGLLKGHWAHNPLPQWCYGGSVFPWLFRSL